MTPDIIGYAVARRSDSSYMLYPDYITALCRAENCGSAPEALVRLSDYVTLLARLEALESYVCAQVGSAS